MEGTSLFAGFIAGVLVSSAVWMIWMGLTFSHISQEIHDERLKWRHLDEAEKQEMSDTELREHWEQP